MTVRTLHSCYVGSKLHRMNNEQSDVDIRYIYRDKLEYRLIPFPPNDIPQSTTVGNTEVQYFELTHFTKLLAKNNPTAMEIMFSDLTMLTDQHLVRQIRNAALDTKMYVDQCHRFIRGMMKGTPTQKQHYHALRMIAHLTIYIKSGRLTYDASRYGCADYLRIFKKAEVNPIDCALIVKQDYEAMPKEPEHIFHRQSLDMLNKIVYNAYLDDLKITQGEI